MNMVTLNSIFNIEYGNQFDLNKMMGDRNGVNFISRTRAELGIVAKVKELDIQPYSAGLITVTLGGSYLLSSYIQPEPFYTAQNIKVLIPKTKLDFVQKLFYCLCIKNNRFKYSSHGREANRTLDELLVPGIDEIPDWVENIKSYKADGFDINTVPESSPYKDINNEMVMVKDLFDPYNGLASSQVKRSALKTSDQFIPYVRPSKTQRTSIDAYVNKDEIDSKYIFPEKTLYVSTDGQGSHTYSYVSVFEFVPNSNVTVLIPKRKMDLQEKLFYALVITNNRRKFSYGRKPKGERLANLFIPLYPPDFVFKKETYKAVTGNIDLQSID